MTGSDHDGTPWEFEVSNIAGIRSGSAAIESGTNVVQAENWQGKSSFLAAVETVLGTTGLGDDTHPLTEGASKGRVELETRSGTYVTELERGPGGTTTLAGDTYLTDETDRVCARLFAFLGEDNPVRAAVRTGDDLVDLLHRPLDLENIDEEIASLREERRRVESDLERAERAAGQLPDVEETITELEGEVESLRERRERIEPVAGDDELADLREQLSDTRADCERVGSDVERIQNKIDRQETKLETLRENLPDLEVPDEPDVDVDVDEMRARIRTLETQIGLLEELYNVNKRVVDENQTDLVTSVQRSISGDELACWVCGETTSERAVADRLDALQEGIDSRRAEVEDLESEIAEIKHRQEEIRVKRRERTRLEESIAELARTVESDRQELATKRERRAALQEEIGDLEARIDDATAEANAELADVESDLKIKRRELEDKREELDRLLNRQERADQLRDRRDELTDRIETLRERKRKKQYELRERFDDEMEDVVEAFDPGFETARLEPKTDGDGEIVGYDLVVARDGRRAPLDALSEGEVELIGIVTALAGYRTFDVDERVPLFLLDGVGQLASTHLHGLVEYLRDDPEMILTTAFPDAGEFDGNVVNPEQWEVVSRDRSAST